MIVSTGLCVKAEPSYQQLLERAYDELKLMAAGKKDLEFLLESDFLQRARISIDDDQYFFKIDIPAAKQLDMFRQGRRRGAGARGGMMRTDTAQQAANDAAIQSIGHSANLVDRVAHAMSCSANLREELSAIEIEEGVDTGPARRHIYHKQAGFFVEIDAQQVSFGHYAVRTAAITPGEMDVTTKLLLPRSESTVYAGVIEETTTETQESAAGLGKRAQFRFVGLNWWQKMALEGAKHLQMPVEIKVTETKSTCTDKFLPLDVNSVNNFDYLLKKTFVGLSDVLSAANDAIFDESDTQENQREKSA